MRCSSCKKKPVFYKRIKLCKTCYVREDMRKRRKDPMFKARANASSRAYVKRNKKIVYRKIKNRRITDRNNTLKRFGNECGFPGCLVKVHLKIHHDHALQTHAQCCKSVNGCAVCRVCALCSKHNSMLGILKHSVKEAMKAVKFLRERHYGT